MTEKIRKILRDVIFTVLLFPMVQQGLPFIKNMSLISKEAYLAGFDHEQQVLGWSCVII